MSESDDEEALKILSFIQKAFNEYCAGWQFRTLVRASSIPDHAKPYRIVEERKAGFTKPRPAARTDLQWSSARSSIARVVYVLPQSRAPSRK